MSYVSRYISARKPPSRGVIATSPPKPVPPNPDPLPDPLPDPSIGIPTLTIDDIVHGYGETIHAVVNQSLRVQMEISGDAKPSYKWEARGGYPMMISDQAATSILSFPLEGYATITCTIRDSDATDSPLSYVATVYVASEK